MIGQIRLLDHLQRLMDARIEFSADSLDGLHIERAQRLFHLLDDQLDSGAQLLGGAGRLEGKLKIVEYGQELLDRVGGGVVAKLAALACFALTGILKLGLQASEPFDERV